MITQAGLLMASDFTLMTRGVESLRHSSIMWDVSTSGSSVSALVPAVLAPPLANSNVVDRMELSDIGEAHGSSTSALMVSRLARESTYTSSGLIQLGWEPDSRAVLATGNSLSLPEVVSLQDGGVAHLDTFFTQISEVPDDFSVEQNDSLRNSLDIMHPCPALVQ
jgi:hypothetical protein